MLGSVFNESRLRPITPVDADLRKAVLRGARTDASLWTTASLTGVRIDVDQAQAFAAAHGLDIHAE